MNKNSRIFVAGHRGLVGSAIVRVLEKQGFAGVQVAERNSLDLRDQAATNEFFRSTSPEYVFLAAARVGGILANDMSPADFLRDNIQIQTNVIDAAWRTSSKKLLFLGSSCMYPRNAPQPMHEDVLMTGPLEQTNEWYAIAKIAGLKMCQAYRKQYGFCAIAVMPTNLYGPGDNFNLETSHVLPALIRKFVEAKRDCRREVVIWGTGTPRREFLHVDDLADALLFVMRHYDEAEPINIGWGLDISIRELAERIALAVEYQGQIVFDPAKPDGTPRKLLDTSRLEGLGWKPRISLEEGIRELVQWYVMQHRPAVRA